MCTGTSEADMSDTDIFCGLEAEVLRIARGSVTVPAVGAMSCRLGDVNGLLRDSDYHNAEFYKSAVKCLQNEIDVFENSARAAAAVRSSKNRTLFTGKTSAELIASAKRWLQKEDPTRSLRGVDALLIKLCASEDSELTKNVTYGSAALRITDKEDFTKSRTRQVVLEIIRIAKRKQRQKHWKEYVPAICKRWKRIPRRQF